MRWAYLREKQAFDEKIAARAAKPLQSGKQPSGKPPRKPKPGSCASDHVNLTDRDSRIMPLSGGGFEQAHHPDWRERFSEPQPPRPDASVVETMAYKLKTQAGRALYALRKQTVEPVFGIIKSVLGFRQCSLRGLDQVRGEWSPVCTAWNLKRMAVLRSKTALNP